MQQFPELPNWTFDVDEVSAGVYRSFGRDKNDHKVELTGVDPDALTEECKQAAIQIMAERESSPEVNAQGTRLEIADTLDSIAAHSGWSDELSRRFDDLLELVFVDGLLAHAAEELIHYSGQFNAMNLLGFRVKPDKSQVESFRDEFRQVAEAIRTGTSWEEYKRANNIFEKGDIKPALNRLFSRLFRL